LHRPIESTAYLLVIKIKSVPHRWSRLSRPAEFHHRPLAEPSVRLSPHSAPIRQTCRPYGLSVTRIEVLLFPVASGMRPPDPTPSLQLHYEPSSLLRVGPPQGSASVRSPRGCRRWASLFASERLVPAVPRNSLHPLHAPSTPVAVRSVIRPPADLSQVHHTLLVLTTLRVLNDASSKGSLSFVSRMLTCTSLFSRFSSNAHHRGSLPQQLGAARDLLLKADPEGPTLIYFRSL